MKYSYNTFNTNYLSDIKLPLAPSAINLSTTVTVTRSQKNISAPPTSEISGLRLNILDSTVYLLIDNIVELSITKQSIQYNILSGIEADIIPFLLYSAIPINLVLQGYMVFRGCAYSTDAKSANCILSSTGDGSSTLLAYALQQGIKGLSDHLCVIRKNDDCFELLPGYSTIKLWHDATKQLQIDNQALPSLRPCLKLYWLQANSDFLEQPLKLNTIHKLSTCNMASTPRSESITGLKKIQTLQNSLWMQSTLEQLGILKNHKQQIIKIATHANINKIKYAHTYCCHQATFNVIQPCEVTA